MQTFSAHRNNRRRRTNVLLKTGCLAHAKHSDNPLPRKRHVRINIEYYLLPAAYWKEGGGRMWGRGVEW